MTQPSRNRRADTSQRIQRCILRMLVTLALAIGSAAADPDVPIRTERVADDRVFAAFADGDYERAASLIEQILAHEPGNVMMLYNGACAYSRLGQLDKSAGHLMRAIESGFRDFEHMKSDPDLAAMRGHDVYEAILEATRRVKNQLPREPDAPAPPRDLTGDWQRRFGTAGYRFERDESRGIAYAIALDEVSFGEMRRMLEQQADFLRFDLFPDIANYEVLIAVPLPQHARELLGEDRVGGMYEHSRRRLIARNIGGSLRHEFFHVMHYRNMEVHGQLHKLWIQEGMAALFEDYRLEGGDRIEFFPNERHNRVKALAQAGKVEKWGSLFDLPDEEFMRRATDLYPQVRSIFEFVADRGLLEPWYRSYVQHFEEDPSGVWAFENSFAASIDDIERQWRLWLSRRPMIDHRVDFGDAALGVRVRPMSSNDGVVIDEVLPGSGAAAARLRAGDVIVGINQQPTRSETELLARIAESKVGQVVLVRVRRDGEYLDVPVTLRALRPR